MQSNEDALMIVVALRGLKLGKSNLGLRFFWPVEMKYRTRARLDKKVQAQTHKLHRKAHGCFYDLAIEQKYILVLIILLRIIQYFGF